MGKGQVTFYIIIGVLIVVVVSFFALNLSSKPVSQAQTDIQLSVKDPYFREYVKQCIDDAVVKANQEYGLNEAKKTEYSAFVSTEIQTCASGLLDNYKTQGYTVVAGNIVVTIDFADETVNVSINYPITMTRGTEKYLFDGYDYTFPRTATEKIGDKETYIVSTDGRATLDLAAGTAANNNGNKIDSIGIKIIDRNFDNLENNIVVGNLVYEGLPDKTTFSKPVTLSIDLRAKDIPIYSGDLSIAYWDENLKIWVGLPTTMKDGVATAEVEHFTKFAVVLNCGPDGNKFLMTPYLFKQKYSIIHPPVPNPDTANLAAQYANEDVGYCMSPNGNTYWIKDGDTYIPSFDEYQKIIGNSGDRIDETIQEVTEKITFGDNGECTLSGNPKKFTANVPSYYCFTDGNCDPNKKIMGLQECMELQGFTKDDLDKTLKECSKDKFPELSSTIKRDIFGYPKGSCIGGTTENGDTDPGVLDIVFDDKGGSCLSKVTGIKIKPDAGTSSGGTCSVTINGNSINSETTIPYNEAGKVGTDGKFHIIIDSAKLAADLDKGASFCQSCKADITLVGTGFSAAGYTVCQNEGDSIYVDGACMKCTQRNGLILANQPVPESDCTCTRQLAKADNDKGTEYCGTFKICHLVNNVPTWDNWVDSKDICNYCPTHRDEPQCINFIPSNEVKK